MSPEEQELQDKVDNLERAIRTSLQRNNDLERALDTSVTWIKELLLKYPEEQKDWRAKIFMVHNKLEENGKMKCSCGYEYDHKQKRNLEEVLNGDEPFISLGIANGTRYDNGDSEGFRMYACPKCGAIKIKTD